MKKKAIQASKSAIFLFELMIVILVFTVAAAICSEIFASAYAMSKESRALTMSAINAQTVAEQFKASDGEAADPLYFDKDWNEVHSADDAKYVVELQRLRPDDPGTPEEADEGAEDAALGEWRHAAGDDAGEELGPLHVADVSVYEKAAGEPVAWKRVYTLTVKEYVG
ncbi:MAG: hypothetical protein LBR44_05780 [Clostridiales Family XIII bacterium]|jgi:Tfp pilus assembly major pilin PilA|nr:hypothetical protein [Clostridiales Family XIII bacterium]